MGGQCTDMPVYVHFLLWFINLGLLLTLLLLPIVFGSSNFHIILMQNVLHLLLQLFFKHDSLFRPEPMTMRNVCTISSYYWISFLQFALNDLYFRKQTLTKLLKGKWKKFSSNCYHGLFHLTWIYLEMNIFLSFFKIAKRKEIKKIMELGCIV